MLINQYGFIEKNIGKVQIERIMQKCAPLRKFCIFRQLEVYRLN